MSKLFACLLLICVATPAAADPLTWLIAAATGAHGFVATIVSRLIIGKATSALAQLFRKDKGAGQSGIQISPKTAGDTVSQNFILGRYMTEAHAVAPEMTHGKSGDTPNAYLTIVVDFSDIPITGFVHAIVDGEPVDFDGAVHSEYGNEATGSFAGKLWFKFYDGNQTAVDPMLLTKYGSQNHRPWHVDMVGRGVSYGIYTVLFDRKVFSGVPVIKSVVDGIKLYDPRKDDTVGGIGNHRFGDISTYEFTRNPIVMNYNLFRGITFPDASVYGGRSSSEQLPLTNWIAGMNKCDELDSDGEPLFQADYNVEVAVHSPLAVVTELNKTCAAKFADVGGVYYIRVGGPGLPVAFITDADILKSKPKNYDPFPGKNELRNGIRSKYVEPAELWAAKEAPEVVDIDAVAADGRENFANVTYPAVTSVKQVQRLNASLLRDERRLARFNHPLKPDAQLVRPLETVVWTSEEFGFTAKLFEVDRVAISSSSMATTWGMREVDPDDWSEQAGDVVPIVSPSLAPIVFIEQSVPGANVTGVEVQDAEGTAKWAGAKFVWNGDLPDVKGIFWEIRVHTTGEIVSADRVSRVGDGFKIVSEGLSSATAYQGRMELDVDRPTKPTNWIDFVTPDVRITVNDLSPQVWTAVRQDAVEQADAAIALFRDGPFTEAQQAQSDFAGVAGQEIARAQLGIQRLAELATQNAIKLGKTERRIIDAGIEVDPDTGNVRIVAVEQQLSQLLAVEQRLSATEGLISLSATLTQVKHAIANAQLSPTDLAALDDVNTRINDVSVSLDAVSAKVDLAATNAEFSAALQNITAIGLTIDAINNDLSSFVTTATFNALSDDVSDVQQLLTTADFPSLVQSVVDARYTKERVDRLAQQGLANTLENYGAGLRNQERIAGVETTLRANIDDVAGVIAAQKVELLAAIEKGNALLTAERVVRVTETSAIAKSVTSLSASLDGQASSITIQAQAIAGLGASIGYSVDVDGNIAGWALQSEIQQGGNVFSSFSFLADAFQISSPNGDVTPFKVYTSPHNIGGVTVPAGVYIQGAKIAGAEIVGDIQSQNYNPVFSPSGGWILRQDGRSEFRDVVISRDNIVASGTSYITSSLSAANNQSFGASLSSSRPITVYINTGVAVPTWDADPASWSASVGLGPNTTLQHEPQYSASDVYWAWEATPLAQSRANFQSTITLRVELYDQHVLRFNNLSLVWSLRRVT